MRFLPRYLVVILLASTLLPSYSHAQGEVPLARELFEKAVAAMQARDWQVAYDALTRSYDISPRPVTLFNLAAAQRKTGRFVESSESYRRFLRETQGQYPDYRKAAHKQLELLNKEIAKLTLKIENLHEGDRILLNGADFAHGAVGHAMPVDPGSFNIQLLRSEDLLYENTVDIGMGKNRIVTILIEKYLPKTVDLKVRKDPSPESNSNSLLGSPKNKSKDDDGSIVTSPWFWGAVGVVAAGSLGIYLWQNQGSDPTDPSWPDLVVQ